MRRDRSFTPAVEALEQLALLATIPFEVANFFGPIVLDMSDSSGDTAFAFPGMQFTIKVEAPGSYMGIKQISYSFSTGILSTDSANTTYTTTTGKYGLVSGATATPDGSPREFMHSWASPKDPGTVTISIAAEVLKYNGPHAPPTTDTLTDTLTLIVEAPTVNSFQVSNDSGPGDVASPFWFGQTTVGLTPSVTGTYMAYMMAGGNPLARDDVGFWASVTNDTHYDLRIGTVQVVDTTLYRSYTDGSSYGASGTDDLDILPDWASYWYQDTSRTYRFSKGTTASIPINNYPFDSPFSRASVTEGPDYLQASHMHMKFDTHLAVGGGWITLGAPEMSGYPIALSTAQWHLDGEAINTANSTNPGGATVVTTTTMANWAVALASGNGPSPASLPGPNGPWIAPGDGVRRYITYDGNSYTTLNALGGSASATQPDAGGTHGDPAAAVLRDRAVAFLMMGLVPVGLLESERIDPLVPRPDRRKADRSWTDDALLGAFDPIGLDSLS